MIKISRIVFALIFATLVTGNVVSAQTTKAVATPQRQLMQSLPDSDAIATLNAKKLLSTALPQLLGADSPKLAEINNHIAGIKDKIGIDLRQFENIAVGIKYKQISATETDFEPVVLAEGSFNANGLLALAKLAANGKYREEKIGERVVYVIRMPEIVKDPKAKPSMAEQAIQGMLRAFSGEIAVGAFDNNTLVAGPLSRVKETIAGTSTLSADMKAAGVLDTNAVLSFSGNVPSGFVSTLGLDALGNDEISKIIGSLKVISGSLDMAGTSAALTLAAKTNTLQQATDLEDMAIGLQSLGKALIGSLKGSPQDKEMYARLLENAKIARLGMQVKMTVVVPQTDLNTLGKKL
jgi:hypothetical protein